MRTVEYRKMGACVRKFFSAIIIVAGAIATPAFFAIAEEEYAVRRAQAEIMVLFAEDDQQARAEMHDTPHSVPRLSDGRFDLLSSAWKRGVQKIVSEGACDRFDMDLAIAGGDNVGFLLAKAQAIVESGCNALAKGASDDVGLNQVREVACHEARVVGDRMDPYVNSQCAAGYRKVLCARYRVCPSLAAMYVAYNRGPTGAQRVDDYHATEYVRKIDFALQMLIKTNT